MEIIMFFAWFLGVALAIMWMFLPWIIVSKLDQVIEQLKKINGKSL